MKLLLIFSILITQVSQKACSPKDKEPSDDKVIGGQTDFREKEEPVITLEKTYCFGACPVFVAEIYPSGNIFYEGTHNVPDSGSFIGKVTSDQISGILKTAEEIDFFSLNDKYDHEGVTDVPTVIIGIRKNGKLKTVINRFEGPEKLKILNDAITRVIESTELSPVKD